MVSNLESVKELKNRKIYTTHIFRSVKGSIGRFIAIFCIFLLGVGFMAGMLSSAPDMRLSADIYFDNANFYDIRVVGTLGITEDDVVSIKKINGVKGVMPCYTFDAVVASDTGDTRVARIASLPFDLLLEENESYINQLTLVSGRMPEKDNEAVFVKRKMSTDGYVVGDKISFTEDNGDLSETFTVDGFTVVGIVESPCYFSIDNENSEVGAGTVEANLYVKEESFCIKAYTDAFVTVEGAKKINSFTDGYVSFIDKITDEITKISGNRCEIRKSEAEKEISDARTELSQGREELDKAKAELEAAKEQIAETEETLRKAEEELEAGKEEYEKNLSLFEEEMEDAKTKLDDARVSLNSMANLISVADGMIEDAKAELERMREEGNGVAADLLQSQLDNLLVYYGGITDEYDAAKKEYEAGLKEYKTSKADAEAKLKDAKTKLDEAEEELKYGKAQLEEAKKQYEQGEKEYEEQHKDAIAELEAGEKKIAEAEKFLLAAGTPEWYVLDRSTDAGFSGFKDNADRIGAIAAVFPIFFFLVAALVALTTMTRMIDEERVQIGTFKALGYSKNEIIKKYIIYSETAAVAGSAVGIFIGVNLLPRVLWNTYGMMYMLGKVYTPIYPVYCVTAVAVAVTLTLVTTVFACRSSLSEQPASLMLPKAPKPGKKILLERVGFIWKHMPFISKVTARNIFRYKKRFFMTVFGIAGCTALLLTGFGLKDSISDIINRQFTDIHRYDAMVALKNNDNLTSLTEYMDSELEGYMLSYQASVTVEKGGKDHNDYIFVTENGERLPEFITLKNRKTKEDIPLDDSGVVITEKTASELNILVGDTVTVTLNNVPAEVNVIGIAENYVYGYVYITEKLYTEKFGELKNYNLITAVFKDGADEKSITTDILQNDSVAQINLIDSMRTSLSNMIDKVNMVVWVLIVAAALLAFAVLYNLINININERRREIATLKVLGFRKGETAAYIFRETSILVVIGAALGLFLGIFLWMFVVKTAEVDMVMFGREISAFSFIISAILTVVFSALVFIAMMPKIKKIDMVESLKSAE